MPPPNTVTLLSPLGEVVKVFKRKDGDITLGRAYKEDNNPELDSGAFRNPGSAVMSRHHARIQWKTENVYIVDQGSTHGTFISDNFPTPESDNFTCEHNKFYPLTEGMWLIFGKTVEGTLPITVQVSLSNIPILNERPPSPVTKKLSTCFSYGMKFLDDDSFPGLESDDDVAVTEKLAGDDDEIEFRFTKQKNREIIVIDDDNEKDGVEEMHLQKQDTPNQSDSVLPGLWSSDAQHHNPSSSPKTLEQDEESIPRSFGFDELEMSFRKQGDEPFLFCVEPHVPDHDDASLRKVFPTQNQTQFQAERSSSPILPISPTEDLDEKQGEFERHSSSAHSLRLESPSSDDFHSSSSPSVGSIASREGSPSVMPMTDAGGSAIVQLHCNALGEIARNSPGSEIPVEDGVEEKDGVAVRVEAPVPMEEQQPIQPVTESSDTLYQIPHLEPSSEIQTPPVDPPKLEEPHTLTKLSDPNSGNSDSFHQGAEHTELDERRLEENEQSALHTPPRYLKRKRSPSVSEPPQTSPIFSLTSRHSGNLPFIGLSEQFEKDQPQSLKQPDSVETQTAAENSISPVEVVGDKNIAIPDEVMPSPSKKRRLQERLPDLALGSVIGATAMFAGLVWLGTD